MRVSINPAAISSIFLVHESGILTLILYIEVNLLQKVVIIGKILLKFELWTDVMSWQARLLPCRFCPMASMLFNCPKSNQLDFFGLVKKVFDESIINPSFLLTSYWMLNFLKVPLRKTHKISSQWHTLAICKRGLASRQNTLSYWAICTHLPFWINFPTGMNKIAFRICVHQNWSCNKWRLHFKIWFLFVGVDPKQCNVLLQRILCCHWKLSWNTFQQGNCSCWCWKQSKSKGT